MKILESQSAVLSNYEVHRHLLEQRNRYKARKRDPPSNFGVIVDQIQKYFKDRANPLSDDPVSYTDASIATLIERLRPYKLEKGEVLMLLNLRPPSIPVLNNIVEFLGDRFSDEDQAAILTIVAEVLSRPHAAPAGGEPADVAMADAGATAKSLERGFLAQLPPSR